MKKAMILFCLVFLISRIAVASLTLPQDDTKKKKRVRRPPVKKDDSIYFKNVFKDALVGKRPEPAVGGGNAQSKMTKSSGGGAKQPAEIPSDGTGLGWSKIISAELLQAEIKKQANLLSQNVTSPGKFKGGGNRDVRQITTMIALVFGVIAEYDGEVKYKEFAAGARDAYAQCAQSATTTSTQAFNQAKIRKEDIQRILSGAAYEPPVKPSEDFEWSSVADVSEMMKRLGVAYREKIKPWVGSESSYKSNIDDLMQEAAMVAVIGEVIQKESMDNADNDDYKEFAAKLKNGALMILNSKGSMDLEMATRGASMIDQSCVECHGEYN